MFKDQQQLRFGGTTLSDDARMLGSYGVPDKGLLSLILSGPASESPPSTVAVTLPVMLQSSFSSPIRVAIEPSARVGELAALLEVATGVAAGLISLSRDGILLANTTATLQSYAVVDRSTVRLEIDPLSLSRQETPPFLPRHGPPFLL